MWTYAQTLDLGVARQQLAAEGIRQAIVLRSEDLAVVAPEGGDESGRHCTIVVRACQRWPSRAVYEVELLRAEPSEDDLPVLAFCTGAAEAVAAASDMLARR